VNEQRLKLSDGRVLLLHTYGSPTGRPVLALHGGGLAATGRFFASADGACRRLDLQLLAPDRLGSNPSTGTPIGTLRSQASDLGALLDELGIQSAPVLAYSGGTPQALSCAVQLARRVSALHLVSAVAPSAAVRTARSVPRAARMAAWAFDVTPDFVLQHLLGRIAQGFAHDPEQAGRNFVRRLPTCERSAMSSGEHQALLATCIAATAQHGARATVRDLRLIASDWQAILGQVEQTVALWHGEEDGTSVPAAARLVAERLPRATLRLVPDAGHLTTWLCHLDEILSAV
jgi:pimeloyl-ACP methyl ester carboxylesterase